MALSTLRLALALGTLALCSAALAQGSGGSVSGRPAGSPGQNSVGSGPSAFATTSSIKGKVTAVSAELHRLGIEDEKGQPRAFQLTSDTKLKADKKAELARKPSLTLDDFAVNTPVRVTYHDTDQTATEVKMLASK